jgi:hypothetical protein
MATEISSYAALAALGLGTPSARAFVAGTASLGVLYAAGYPKQAFRDDGSMRPFAPLTPGPDGVSGSHFLVLPLTIATVAFLFT